MASVTQWVRQALAHLGPNATPKQVTDYILSQEPTVPRGYISLAMRKLAAAKRQPRGKKLQVNQTTLFPEA
jgi:hypothetical protein